jgi:hypothetical protein
MLPTSPFIMEVLNNHSGFHHLALQAFRIMIIFHLFFSRRDVRG